MSQRPDASPFSEVSSIDDVSQRLDVDDSLFSTPTKRGDRTGLYRMSKKSHLRSFLLVSIGFIVCFIQLGSWQLAQGEAFYELSTRNRVREAIIPAKRGIIKDRQGVLLAQNTPSFQLFLNENYFTQNAERQEEIRSRITQVTGFPVDGEMLAEQGNIDSYILSSDINRDTALSLLSWNDRYPEYTVESISKRSYITDYVPSLSHVLGYIGKITPEQYQQRRSENYRLIDSIGQSGIERFYEDQLRGTPGRRQVEVNAFNNVQRIASIADPIPGEDMQLTLDVSLQSHIESVLLRRLANVGHSRASVIVMNPHNGEILALVSWPAYDANTFVNQDQTAYVELLENPDRPLFHRAISGAYPSGSTIKPLYVAAALIEKIVTPTTSFMSSGGLQVGPWFFPDWQGGGHGATNAYKAIAESVNTYFYIVGGGYDTFQGLGIERLTSYARLFGLASKTGIDQAGESAGFLPSPEWKLEAKGERWYVGDTFNVSIGQGDVLTTPLQMARTTSVFANGGKLVTPHLLMGAGTEPERIIPEDIARVVQQGMRQTVTAGTSKTLQMLPVTAAGKTGTAQWSSGKANHSWYVGYAPYENPEVVITVLVEEDKIGSTAVPIVLDVLQFWFDENNDRGTI